MKKTFLYILALSLVSMSCVNETYFGESTQANIVTFAIQGEMNNKVEPLVDWQDVGTVTVTVPSSFDLSNLKVTNVVCSQLSHFADVPTNRPDTLRDFSTPIELYIISEKGVTKKWVVTVVKQAVSNAQLPFSDMTQWAPAVDHKGVAITLKGVIGYFPGNGVDNSPWNSTIAGNALGLSGISEFSVLPNTVAREAQYARLTTVKTQSGALMGAGVAAGGLFTGQFILNPDYVIAEKAPRKMMNTGVPFYSKPTSVTFDIRYKAGEQMVDGKLNPILPGTGKPTKDSCDVMFALQNRLSEPNVFIRVATASLRVGAIGDLTDDAGGFVSVTLPLIYGEPTAEQIAEKPYQRIGGATGELFFYTFTKNGDKWDVSPERVAEKYAADPATIEVDNMVVMFSSSTYGDLFYAAVGSTMDIKNIKFSYENL